VSKVLAVAQRVLRQLAADRRFLFLSLVLPMLILAIAKAAIETLNNPFIDISQLVVPIGAFVVHFVTYVLCAIVLVRERTMHTLARMFVSGYRQVHIIGGYVLAYTALGTLQSLAIMLELRQLFNLSYRVPTLVSLYLVIWLLAIISISLGILVSNFARTEGQIFPFIPMVTIPGIFLSDVIISLDRMPLWAQWLGRATPLYHANRLIQRLIRPDATLAANWLHIGTLVLYIVVVMTLATRTLRESD
jgi:ABC-2 type transport system permease protein